MKEVTIQPKEAGQKPLHFKEGGLHATTHTPMNEKIPKSKIQAALVGKYGNKGKKQAMFMKNVLVGKK